jgi:hypothetical protein
MFKVGLAFLILHLDLCALVNFFSRVDLSAYNEVSRRRHLWLFLVDVGDEVLFLWQFNAISVE